MGFTSCYQLPLYVEHSVSLFFRIQKCSLSVTTLLVVLFLKSKTCSLSDLEIDCETYLVISTSVDSKEEEMDQIKLRKKLIGIKHLVMKKLR